MWNVTHLLTVLYRPDKTRLLLSFKRRPLEQLAHRGLALADPKANVDQRLSFLPHPVNVLPTGKPVLGASLTVEQPDGLGYGYFVFHVIK